MNQTKAQLDRRIACLKAALSVWEALAAMEGHLADSLEDPLWSTLQNLTGNMSVFAAQAGITLNAGTNIHTVPRLLRERMIALNGQRNAQYMGK